MVHLTEGETIRVPLKGKGGAIIGHATIDREDARLLKFSWRLGRDGYARRDRLDADEATAPTQIAMHREILGLHVQRSTNGGIDVDHIDGDRLNNRRSNLRAATRAENNMNWLPKGRYRGVAHSGRDDLRAPWKAYVHFNRRMLNIGYFRTPEEAAVARDKRAKELFGDFAALNFPELA